MRENSKNHNDIFCTTTNKFTIISQIITLLHVSTVSCHPQGACNEHLSKLHKYFKLYYVQLLVKQFTIVLPKAVFEILI